MNRSTFRLIERLIRNISHEIKNPLTSVKGYAQLLLLKPDDRQLILKSQQNIIKQIESMEAMLNNMYRIFLLKESISGKIEILDVIESFISDFKIKVPNDIKFIHDGKTTSMDGNDEYFKRLLDLLIMGFDWQHQKNTGIELHLDCKDELPILRIILNGSDFSDLDRELFYLPFYSKKYYTDGTSLYEASIISVLSGWNLSMNDTSNGFTLVFNGKKL